MISAGRGSDACFWQGQSVTLSRMAEMPRGAVTFLFTDIEGSTRLVKQLRESYGDVLDEHQRLLREAFKAHRGYEVDTQGDSFFVAFSSARDALLAAVEGQLALLNHPWPDGVRIKVRMGLHTGQAVVSGGRYTGLAVHRAARIGATGHGGQILVSQATQTLVEDEEEDLHIHLQDLGEQRVKDLDRPVRLYQANSDGLPAEFAPLRPAPASPAPFWRRRAVLGAAALVLGAIVLAVIAVAFLNGGPASVPVAPNSLAVIDPKTNLVVKDIPTGKRPGPVTFGAGSIWVGNLDDRNVTRIDAEQRVSVRVIGLEDRTPTGLAFGFRYVWVAHGITGQLSRIDPQFNKASEAVDVADPAAFGSQNGSVAVGPGSVWVVFNDGTLARIKPTSGSVAEQGRAGLNPAGIVVADGSVWVSNAGEARVGRYSPAAFAEGPLDEPYSVGGRPTGLAYGEGAIWVANNASNSVSWIDPDSSGEVDQVPVGESPTTVAVGDHAVWVVNSGDGTVSEIDPGTNDVKRKIELGNKPYGIVFAYGFLWVTVQAP
jgi:YVTN family beta-propeller protein